MSLPARAPRTLRSHLMVLILGTVLPLLLFGIATTALIIQRERESFRQGALERTRAMLTAVDAELSGHVARLKLLAKSRELEQGSLDVFRQDIERTVPTQPFWRSVSLALPSGERLLDSEGLPPGSSHEVMERRSFEAAVSAGRPVVGDLHERNGAQHFAVRLPVVQDHETRYVLSAIVDPGSILALLERQQVPPDWVLVVLDGEGRVVARTSDHDGTFGQPASESLRAALDQAPEGWFRGSTLEGAEVYTSYARSTISGWSVAFGVPAGFVQMSTRRALWMLGVAVVVAVTVAILLGTALTRRISRPIASLVTLAKALGGGPPVETPETEDIQEVSDVGRALRASAERVREREEALRAADRAKDEFLAMLGHELRNPLSAITSAAEVLRLMSPPEGPSRESAAIVARQAGHMTRLVDDLLDVSRVTRGKITLTRQPLELGQVVRSTLDVLRRAERLDEHELHVETDRVWIDADAARVEQIISNLVSNAVKYTPSGGRIEVLVARRGDEAVLEVSDTGIGLAGDMVDRVFDLFVQAERGLDRGLGGLGIGLTLVRRLAELHGGSVTAASDGHGRGSRFTVRFPAIAAPPTTPPGPNHTEPDGQRRSVLLIEDNEDARQTLALALEWHGYEVHQAAEGGSGLDLAAAVKPDAAVVDIGLPGLDGFEVARRLRSTAHGERMLLVALSGYGQAESRHRAQDAGFDTYLTKPVTPDSLVQRLAADLTRRRSPGSWS